MFLPLLELAPTIYQMLSSSGLFKNHALSQVQAVMGIDLNNSTLKQIENAFSPDNMTPTQQAALVALESAAKDEIVKFAGSKWGKIEIAVVSSMGVLAFILGSLFWAVHPLIASSS